MSNECPDVEPVLNPPQRLIHTGKEWVPADKLTVFVVEGDIEYECRPVIGLRWNLDDAVKLCQQAVRYAADTMTFDRHYIHEWPIGGEDVEPLRSWVYDEGRLAELPKIEDLIRAREEGQ